MTASVIAKATRGAEVGVYDPVKWGDFQMLSSAKTLGPNVPVLTAFGATMFAYKFAVGDILYLVDGQFDHDWDFSPIRPHMHFSSDNGGTGNIVWEMIYSYRTVFGTWSADVTDSITWSGTLAAGAGSVADFWTGDGDVITSPTPSLLMRARIKLVSKTFAGNVFLDGWDCHYRKNRSGTDSEFI